MRMTLIETHRCRGSEFRLDVIFINRDRTVADFDRDRVGGLRDRRFVADRMRKLILGYKQGSALRALVAVAIGAGWLRAASVGVIAAVLTDAQEHSVLHHVDRSDALALLFLAAALAAALAA